MTGTESKQRNPLLKAALIGTLAFGVTACTQEEQGTVFGAIIGAVIGNSIEGGGRRGNSGAGMVIGTMIGASIGNSVGKKLDDADRREMRRAHTNAFESNRSGQRSNWHNPDSGNRGWVEPEPAYQNTYGQYCREYTQTVVIGGEEQQGYGKACRQPDGTWEIVNPNSNKYKDKPKKNRY